MIRRFFNLLILFLALTASQRLQAADYTEYLTASRGFVEVTSLSGIVADENYYYILTPAETTDLIVGVGVYEVKPGWASEESKALRYLSADTDPVLNRSNFFTIEEAGGFIGLRNVVYSADMFQTHQDAGFMYVNTYTDKSLDEWSYLTPAYQDGYWTFESGKYPLSGENFYSGFLGPWNKEVATNEPLALNRKNTEDDLAGHFRLFRIKKTTFEDLFKAEQSAILCGAASDNPVDATWLITNPSFETGDVTGWTRNPDVTDDPEFTTRDYAMTSKEGGYLFNAYQWWAQSLSVSQTITDVPQGLYRLSAVVSTWENRTVTFTVNGASVSNTGMGDATGIAVSQDFSVNDSKSMTITAGSTAEWWTEGHETESQTFFKLDNLKLTCLGVYISAIAKQLPDNNVTKLTPGQWYYYDVTCKTDYTLTGKLSSIVYTTDGDKMTCDVSTQPVEKEMTLAAGRIYFMTTATGTTLKLTASQEMEQTSFTACALNVDGLPQTIAGVYELNPDGPGSDGTKLISQYLAGKGYSLIGFSEDFNYHGSLTSSMSEYSWGTHRGALSLNNLSFPFDTDGLEFAWKTSDMSVANEVITQFTTSEGGLNDGANTIIKKGFRSYEVTLKDGVVIDVYVAHMDAEDHVASREAQWAQIASVMNTSNTSRPKLLIGDTNSRWTRENIKGNFTDLLTNFDVSDVWVELCRDNVYPTTTMNDLTDQSVPSDYSKYEVVDKILYLNPKAAGTPQLCPTSFKIEQDYVDGDGNLLGDHRPVVVNFVVTQLGEKSVLTGDVNKDGKISIADVTALVNLILGKEGNYSKQAADMNEDGNTSIADVTALVNLILNMD